MLTSVLLDQETSGSPENQLGQKCDHNSARNSAASLLHLGMRSANRTSAYTMIGQAIAITTTIPPTINSEIPIPIMIFASILG